MTEKDYADVTVKEAAHDDAGRGIARLLRGRSVIEGQTVRVDVIGNYQ
jgi:hypothetical protein